MKCPKCHFENPETQKFCGECGQPLPSTPLPSPGPPSTPTDAFPTQTIESHPRELATGTTFAGRYQIIEELGKGGMGRVYKVFDTKIKEKIALKLIRPEIISDQETVERFRNEIRLARKIRHKKVCQMFDLGESGGTHFITMEYVPGEDLKNMLRMSKSMSIGAAVNVARQISEGLVEAHSLGVVHRDLKPGNIMIDRDGEVRIMDFGVARTLKEKGVTGAGLVVGTPEYMSPEQVEGLGVDAQSDLYSLGVILYEMVTGRRPFEGHTALSVALKQKTEMPKDPRELNAQVPEALSRLILKCLEKDKRKRCGTAEEILAELFRIEEGIPTPEKAIPQGKPLTSREITVKLNVKKMLVPALVVAAVVVAVAAFFLLGKPGLPLNPKLILVSIFENQTGDTALDPLGQVAANWIAQGLSQTGLLEVVPSLSVMQSSRIINAETGVPKGVGELRALAKETGAGTVVSGSYYLIDQELQFHAEITDIVHRSKLIQRLEPLKGRLEDKMGLITELRQRIMGALTMHFMDSAISELVLKARRPPVYEAFQEFIQGMELFGVSYEQSVRHLKRAVELDPTYAQPKLYIAVASGNLGQYDQAAALLEPLFEKRDELTPLDNHLLDWYDADLKGRHGDSVRFIREAEKLVPRSPVVNYLVGLEAIEINHPQETIATYAKLDDSDLKLYSRFPSMSWRFNYLAYAHHMLGDYNKELGVVKTGRRYFPQESFRLEEANALAALGKTKEVNKTIEECLREDPTGGTPGRVMQEAAEEFYAHGYKDASRDVAARAIEWYRSRPEDEKKTESYQLSLANALNSARQWEEAGKIFETLAAGHPDNIDYQGYLGSLAARRGDRAQAMKISEELSKIDRPYLFGNHTYWRACITALLGDKERAVALLRESFDQGRRYGIALHRDVDLEPLWDYPPFKEILRPKG